VFDQKGHTVNEYPGSSRYFLNGGSLLLGGCDKHSFICKISYEKVPLKRQKLGLKLAFVVGNYMAERIIES